MGKRRGAAAGEGSHEDGRVESRCTQGSKSQVRREGRSLDRSIKLSLSSKRGSSTGKLKAGKTHAFNVAAAAEESAGWTSGVEKVTMEQFRKS